MIRARLLLALGILSGLACAPHDVVVGNLPDPDGGHVGPGCERTSDCMMPGDFCEKASCTSVGGHCRHRELLGCDSMAAPSCGCNNVTYWNDCLRRQDGVEAASPGACTSGNCNDSSNCLDSKAVCARLLPDTAACTSAPTGTCWVMPSVCPTPMLGAPSWSLCSGSPSCVDSCAAIKSAASYQRGNCP